MRNMWDKSIYRRGAGVLSSLSDAIVVTDSAGTIVRTNPAAERLLGRSAAELTGSEPPYSFWSPETADQIDELLHVGDDTEDAPAPWADTSYTHVSGRRIAVRVTLCRLGNYHLHIAAPRPEPDTGSAEHDPLRDRISSLEVGLRNIAWELQALGVHAAGSWVRPGTVPPAALRELTGRQREVLDAFIEGHSVAATAAQLHLSEHTVRSHLKVVYRKMGVRSQTELMRRIANVDTT